MQSSAHPHPIDPKDHALARAIDEQPVLVIGFCAEWCNTCGDFRTQFDQIATMRGDATFVWLDIEEHAALLGDLDIENFPTIAVFHRRRLIHFGTTLPQSPVVLRLLDALGDQSDTMAGDQALIKLPESLANLPLDEAGRVFRS